MYPASRKFYGFTVCGACVHVPRAGESRNEARGNVSFEAPLALKIRARGKGGGGGSPLRLAKYEFL